MWHTLPLKEWQRRRNLNFGKTSLVLSFARRSLPNRSHILKDYILTSDCLFIIHISCITMDYYHCTPVKSTGSQIPSSEFLQMCDGWSLQFSIGTPVFWCLIQSCQVSFNFLLETNNVLLSSPHYDTRETLKKLIKINHHRYGIPGGINLRRASGTMMPSCVW